MRVQRIRFQGEEWILIDRLITTEEAFTNFEPPYAGISDDGFVMRYHQIIGTSDEIEVLGDAEHDGPTLDAVCENFDHPGWGPLSPPKEA